MGDNSNSDNSRFLMIVLILSIAVNAFLGYEYFATRGIENELSRAENEFSAMSNCSAMQPMPEDVVKSGIDSIAPKLKYNAREQAAAPSMNKHFGMISSLELLKMIGSNLKNNVMLIYPMWDNRENHERVAFRFAKATVSSGGCPNYDLELDPDFYSPTWCPEICPQNITTAAATTHTAVDGHP